MIEIAGVLASREPKEGDPILSFYLFENSEQCTNLEKDGISFAHKIDSAIRAALPGDHAFGFVSYPTISRPPPSDLSTRGRFV